MYPDLWTGGKCVYKVEPVVADGGELIVYAPHVTRFSEVHQREVEALGYHVRDYYLAHEDRYAHLPRAVMAYSVIVKGDGRYVDGKETTRIRVSFATGISRRACEAVGHRVCRSGRHRPCAVARSRGTRESSSWSAPAKPCTGSKKGRRHDRNTR